MQKNKITVIVPCYNVEKYIKNSIESLLKQTYENIEIIAIDDCSTDNTYNILKELAKEHKDKLLIYRNDKNSGSGYTRNRGISLAQTPYIGFIDSDDYIDNTYYEKLMTAIIEKNADIAITDMILVNAKGQPLGPVQPGINPYVEGDMKEAFLDNGLSASPCNKVFKKELLEKHPFLEGKMNEDIASIIPTVLKADSIVYVDTVKYYYVQRENSTQNSEFSEKRFDIFDSVSITLERIKDIENFEKYKTIILYHQILMVYVYLIIPLTKYKDRQKFIKMFIQRQGDLAVEKNQACVKKYLDTRQKLGKIYWYIVINLLRFKSATLINLIATLAHAFINRKQKTVIKKDINFLDILEVAKKQKSKKKSKISISVIVPNYNYQEFLLQRIYSILNQTEKITELILLDDCSTDNSRELIDDLVEKLKPYIEVKKIYNEKNTGSAFKQWQKGFNLAKGDYIWIAEADDYCNKKMLKKLVKCIKKDNKISIAYVDTAFIDKDGKIVLKTIKPEIDIRKTGHWDHSYITSGESELQDYAFLNCTIANVSSCLIKKGNYDKIFEKAGTFKQAGDWVFYANVMKLGDIAFVNKPYNYYRLHGSNISSNTKKQKHLEEIQRIHNSMREITSITTWHEKEFEKRYEFLRRVWELE